LPLSYLPDGAVQRDAGIIVNSAATRGKGWVLRDASRFVIRDRAEGDPCRAKVHDAAASRSSRVPADGAVTDLHVAAGIADAAAACSRIVNNGAADDLQRRTVVVHNVAAGVLYTPRVAALVNWDTVITYGRLDQLEKAAVGEATARPASLVILYRASLLHLLTQSRDSNDYG
jgi:hypothetical protein